MPGHRAVLRSARGRYAEVMFQRIKKSAESKSTAVHRRAGGSSWFPHRQALERSLGRGISGSARVDGSACERLGVPAYTVGQETLFAEPTPTLEVAAHEATHQLQHAGATRDLDIGPERHAALVADTVRRGADASGLLSQRGSTVSPGVRPYTEFAQVEPEMKGQGDWSEVVGRVRLADNRESLTVDLRRHVLFATEERVEHANRKLEAVDSGVRLVPMDNQITGGILQDQQLVQVRPLFLRSPLSAEFYQDCGRAAREIMGKWGRDATPAAVFGDKQGNEATTTPRLTPDAAKAEVLRELGVSEAEYAGQSNGEDFDRKHGINDFAMPGVGDAYVFARAPNSKYGEVPADDFHWAGVVLAAGDDRVALENFAVSTKYSEVNEKWNFASYGPANKPGQTFYDRWEHWGQGREEGAMVMVARQVDYSKWTTSQLLNSYNAIDFEEAERHDDATHRNLRKALRSRHMWVTVTVNEQRDYIGKDEVAIDVKGPFWQRNVWMSGSVGLGEGEHHDFRIRIADIITGGRAHFVKEDPIRINVLEEEALTYDRVKQVEWEYDPQHPDGFPPGNADSQGYGVAVELDQRSS